MAWCLMAPSHYLNQCWLIIPKIHMYTTQHIFCQNSSKNDHKIQNWIQKLHFWKCSNFPRACWVKPCTISMENTHPFRNPIQECMPRYFYTPDDHIHVTWASVCCLGYCISALEGIFQRHRSPYCKNSGDIFMFFQSQTDRGMAPNPHSQWQNPTCGIDSSLLKIVES